MLNQPDYETEEVEEYYVKEEPAENTREYSPTPQVKNNKFSPLPVL